MDVAASKPTALRTVVISGRTGCRCRARHGDDCVFRHNALRMSTAETPRKQQVLRFAQDDNFIGTDLCHAQPASHQVLQAAQSQRLRTLPGGNVNFSPRQWIVLEVKSIINVRRESPFLFGGDLGRKLLAYSRTNSRLRCTRNRC